MPPKGRAPMSIRVGPTARVRGFSRGESQEVPPDLGTSVLPSVSDVSYSDRRPLAILPQIKIAANAGFTQRREDSSWGVLRSGTAPCGFLSTRPCFSLTSKPIYIFHPLHSFFLFCKTVFPLTLPRGSRYFYFRTCPACLIQCCQSVLHRSTFKEIHVH